MGEFDGKVAIVTGAGRLRSIGKSTALSLARLGANVVVTGTGRDPARYPDDEKAAGWRDIESTAELVRAEGREALPLVVDVADSEQVQAMADRIMNEFGRIDIVVNNAAYAMQPSLKPIVDLPDDIFQKVLDVKVRGTYLCTKAAIPHMIERGEGGKIINISSVQGKGGREHNLAYVAACHALVGMTQSMAHELGPHGINVNCVCPGSTDTARTDFYDREQWLRRGDNAPIGRNGTPEEVGDFIAYLCTEATSWIHGQSININGGTLMEH